MAEIGASQIQKKTPEFLWTVLDNSISLCIALGIIRNYMNLSESISCPFERLPSDACHMFL